MQDEEMIALYFARNEQAIQATMAVIAGKLPQTF